jgi:hypothetical protein
MKNTLRWPRLLLSVFGAILLLLAACDAKPEAGITAKPEGNIEEKNELGFWLRLTPYQ